MRRRDFLKLAGLAGAGVVAAAVGVKAAAPLGEWHELIRVTAPTRLGDTLTMDGVRFTLPASGDYPALASHIAEIANAQLPYEFRSEGNSVFWKPDENQMFSLHDLREVCS